MVFEMLESLASALLGADDDDGVDGRRGPVLPCCGRLRVEVVDADGNPVPSAAIDVPELPRRHTDQAGCWVYDQVAPGRYSVTARKSDGHTDHSRPLSHPVEVLAGATTDVLIALPRYHVPVTSVRLLRIQCETAYPTLSNRTADWRAGGQRYAALQGGFHWSAAYNYPFVHAKNAQVRLRAVFAVRGPDADRGTVRMRFGDAAVAHFEGQADFVARSTGADVEVEVVITSALRLPNKIFRKESALRWSVDLASGNRFAGRTDPLEIFVVADNPIATEVSPPNANGVTIKRMRVAMERAEAVNSNNPFTIANALVGLFPTYSLVRNMLVPAANDHPEYRGSPGSWALHDHVAHGAQCQAIVRWMEGIMRIVGIQGVSITYVSTRSALATNVIDAANPADTLVGQGYANYSLVDLRGCLPGDLVGMGPVPFKVPFQWHGHEVEIKDNTYEACLKVVAGGVTRWYGGGAGRYRSAMAVLRDFHAYVQVAPQEDGTYQVTQVIRNLIAEPRDPYVAGDAVAEAVAVNDPVTTYDPGRQGADFL